MVEFQGQIAKKPLKVVFEKYKLWLNKNGVSSLMKYLRCYHKLLLFELNTCYKGWYRTSAVSPTSGSEKIDGDLVRDELKDLEQRGEIDQGDKKKYLKRLKHSRHHLASCVEKSKTVLLNGKIG